jgi:hypothetical protein
LVALFAFGVFNAYLRIQQPVYLFAGLLFFAGLNLSYLWTYWRAVGPLRYLVSGESREDYLTLRLPEFAAYQYINHELPLAAKIYLLFVGRRAYYSEREYFHDGGELPGFLLEAIRSAKEPGDVARQLKAKQLTHLLVRDELLIRFLSDNLTPTQQRIWDGLNSAHLTPLFHRNGYSVLQLHG